MKKSIVAIVTVMSVIGVSQPAFSVEESGEEVVEPTPTPTPTPTPIPTPSPTPTETPTPTPTATVQPTPYVPPGYVYHPWPATYIPPSYAYVSPTYVHTSPTYISIPSSPINNVINNNQTNFTMSDSLLQALLMAGSMYNIRYGLDDYEDYEYVDPYQQTTVQAKSNSFDNKKKKNKKKKWKKRSRR